LLVSGLNEANNSQPKGARMTHDDAVQALLALGQSNRLHVFRMIVEHGDIGLFPSEIADRLQIAPATLSFHLKELTQAKLISAERQSRHLLYKPCPHRIEALRAFLLLNCCGNQPCEASPQQGDIHEVL
jgi:DNA-binding transcriptional ArsR family regulator